jgi:hypothetical protein
MITQQSISGLCLLTSDLRSLTSAFRPPSSVPSLRFRRRLAIKFAPAHGRAARCDRY